MVVEPFNAHDDYGDDCARNDRRTTTISQAVSQSWNTRELHARVLSLVSETDLRIRSLITLYISILEYFNNFLYTFNFNNYIRNQRKYIVGNIYIMSYIGRMQVSFKKKYFL